jgi:hypothetical protein
MPSWLGAHAIGLFLVALGVALTLVLLLPALRTRERLNSGARAQGTVVGAEKKTGHRRGHPHHLPPPEGAVRTPPLACHASQAG